MTGRCFSALLLLCLAAVSHGAVRYPYQACFETASRLHDVPLDLLLAVAATESNWNADARSHANAHGIMQIQWPGTARHLGVRRVAELYNPCLNISLGAQYLAELTGSFGEERRALAAYNYGPTRIRQSDALPEGAKRYVATVTRHRERINGGSVPEALQRATRTELVTFDSRGRARRLAATLTERLDGATVSVERSRPARGYTVVLGIGTAGLSLRDKLTLQTMGWSL